MTAFLHFDDLTKSYYEGDLRRVVLQNAHAEFQRGQITSILGKSGSGKSTLLNLISGIDAPDSGHVWVDGQDLTALSERDRTLFRRARIGFIFQFFNLIPMLTVGENVSLPLELNHMPRKQADKKAQELLDDVGLLDRWGTFPEKLSGGEQQRVALGTDDLAVGAFGSRTQPYLVDRHTQRGRYRPCRPDLAVDARPTG
jgi:putative ABC transport system ATP-binding protein